MKKSEDKKKCIFHDETVLRHTFTAHFSSADSSRFQHHPCPFCHHAGRIVVYVLAEDNTFLETFYARRFISSEHPS